MFINCVSSVITKDYTCVRPWAFLSPLSIFGNKPYYVSSSCYECQCSHCQAGVMTDATVHIMYVCDV